MNIEYAEYRKSLYTSICRICKVPQTYTITGWHSCVHQRYLPHLCNLYICVQHFWNHVHEKYLRKWKLIYNDGSTHINYPCILDAVFFANQCTGRRWHIGTKYTARLCTSGKEDYANSGLIDPVSGQKANSCDCEAPPQPMQAKRSVAQRLRMVVSWAHRRVEPPLSCPSRILRFRLNGTQILMAQGNWTYSTQMEGAHCRGIIWHGYIVYFGTSLG